MIIMANFDQLASEESIQKTSASLMANGINVFVVENGIDAKNKVLEIIPAGAEVMLMSSQTLMSIGLSEVVDSGKYDSVKLKLAKMNRQTQSSQMKKIGAAPDWTVGSVHAITEDGKLVIVSNTGSQLGAYAYSSPHVVWVVGTQKIVPDLETAIQRINDYVLPLESQRVQKAYGMPNSNISKMLIINKEISTNRATLILVKEKLGF